MADFASGTNPQRLESPSQHHLVLLKGDHAWTFRWTDGDEHRLIDALSDLAAGPEVGFDWFDAAMMRHQLCEFMNGTTGNNDSLQ